MIFIISLERLFYAVLLLNVVYEGLLVTANEYDAALNTSLAGIQACVMPRLDVNNSVIMSYVKDLGPLICNNEEDWVQINGNKAFITRKAKQRFGKITCRFTDIIRETDHTSKKGITTESFSEYKLKKSDIINVDCISKKQRKWQNVMVGIRHDQKVLDRTGWDKVPKDGLHLNVLIWVFDSVSRLTFARKLPRTLHYLRDTLRAFELQGFNTVGLNTLGNIIPLLTGKKPNELPEIRKHLKSKVTYIDEYPFIWKNFHANGYVTGFMEDMRLLRRNEENYGSFTEGHKAFNTQPVDHYIRSFYVPGLKEKSPPYCRGSLPRYKVMLNYIRNFFKVYNEKPKFMFAKCDELSHQANVNPLGYADNDLQQWLKSMFEEGHLNSTLLIIMSDHGSGLAKYRATQQGKLEQRLPMASLVFPQWFIKAYPLEIRNMRRNIERLTTPFDIYSTLRNVLHFYGAGYDDLKNKSISLFKEIPLERTCANANVDIHFCACLVWEETPVSHSIVQRAAHAIVDFINRITGKRKTLCKKFKLQSVFWAGKLLATQDLLRFQHKDEDGFDLLGQGEASREAYQLQIRVQPGGFPFEVTLTYNRQTEEFIIKKNAVARLDGYGPFTQCLTEEDHDLLKYCYCR